MSCDIQSNHTQKSSYLRSHFSNVINGLKQCVAPEAKGILNLKLFIEVLQILFVRKGKVCDYHYQGL